MMGERGRKGGSYILFTIITVREIKGMDAVRCEDRFSFCKVYRSYLVDIAFLP